MPSTMTPGLRRKLADLRESLQYHVDHVKIPLETRPQIIRLHLKKSKEPLIMNKKPNKAVVSASTNKNNNENSVPTLRDQFAMYALSGLLADTNCDLPSTESAELAYDYADAMMKAR